MTLANTVHATCVEVNGKGVLLCGKSGRGKSDLALRLIDRGHFLVSDDQVRLQIHEKNQDQKLLASPPDALKGMLEVRGVGICQFEFKNSVDIALIVDLKAGSVPQRMPDFATQRKNLLGIELPFMMLDPFQSSACLKIIEALKILPR